MKSDFYVNNLRSIKWSFRDYSHKKQTSCRHIVHILKKFTWFSIRFSLRTGQARSFVKLLSFLKKLFFVVLTGCFGFNFFFCLGLVWFLLVLVSFTCSRYNFLLKGKLVLISGFSQGLVRSFNLGTLTQPKFTCSNLTIETVEQGVKYVPS